MESSPAEVDIELGTSRKESNSDFKPKKRHIYLKKTEETAPIAAASINDEDYYLLVPRGEEETSFVSPNLPPEEVKAEFQTVQTSTLFLFQMPKDVLHYRRIESYQVFKEVRVVEEWFSWYQQSITSSELTKFLNQLGPKPSHLVTKKFHISLEPRNRLFHLLNWNYYNGFVEFLFFGAIWFLGLVMSFFLGPETIPIFIICILV